jgi:hypothetical protein
MTETQSNDVSYSDVMNAITELSERTMAQHEQIIFKLESILISRTSPVPKKPVVKKVKGAAVPKMETAKPISFANTMYWWIYMYVNKDPLIANMVTPEENVKAIEKMGDVAFAPDSCEYDRALSSALWKVFPKQKKIGELKTKYENWKKEMAKENAEDVVAEVNSDDEK